MSSTSAFIQRLLSEQAAAKQRVLECSHPKESRLKRQILVSCEEAGCNAVDKTTHQHCGYRRQVICALCGAELSDKKV